MPKNKTTQKTKMKLLTKLKKQKASLTILRVKLFSISANFISERALPSIAINYTRELVNTSLKFHNHLQLYYFL